MNTSLLRHLYLTVALLLGTVSAGASSLCSMSGEDLLSVLSAMQANGKSAEAVSAKETVSADRTTPLDLTVRDMMTKVYGVMSDTLGRAACVDGSASILGIEPEKEEGGYVWMDQGYSISYKGMTPEVAAVARFAGDDAGGKVQDYSFFFLFPYEEHTDQCEFSEALLRDIHSAGANPGVNVNSDDLYDVVASYAGSLVDVRLIDDTDTGRYVLILSVEPAAFTSADDLAAL